jgi:hypothetical protein
MKACPNCAGENRESDAVCLYCGASLISGRATEDIAIEKAKAPEASREAKPDLEQGIEAFKRGDLQTAIDALRRAAEENHGDPRAFTYLGAAYYQKGQYAGAVTAFMRAAELQPQVANIHYNLGLAAQGKGMFDKAREAFKKALEIDPDYAKASEALYRLQQAAAEEPKEEVVYCANHPNDIAVGRCIGCGKMICAACGEPIEEGARPFGGDDSVPLMKCHSCAGKTEARERAPGQAAYSPPGTPPVVSGGAPPSSPTATVEPEAQERFAEPEKPPSYGGYRAGQAEAMAARRAAVEQQIAKGRMKRNAIITVIVLVVLIGAPIVFFEASGGFAKGMTKLSTVFTFINKYEASDGSFSYNPPWGWKKAEKLSDVFGSLGMLGQAISQGMTTQGGENLAFTAPNGLLAGGIVVSSGGTEGKTLDALKEQARQVLAQLGRAPGASVDIRDTIHMGQPAFEVLADVPLPDVHVRLREIVMIGDEKGQSFLLVGDANSYDTLAKDFEMTLKSWRPKLSGLEGVKESRP